MDTILNHYFKAFLLSIYKIFYNYITSFTGPKGRFLIKNLPRPIKVYIPILKKQKSTLNRKGNKDYKVS